MSVIVELKAATDQQLNASLRLAGAARELNGLRLRMEGEGRSEDADALGRVIQSLIGEARDLTANAQRTGRGLVDAIRTSW